MDPTDNVIQFPSPDALGNHAGAIRESLLLVENTILKDLIKLYRLKAAGQPVEIPTEIIVKDVVVRLS